jgi:hypothetical protein
MNRLFQDHNIRLVISESIRIDFSEFQKIKSPPVDLKPDTYNSVVLSLMLLDYSERECIMIFDSRVSRFYDTMEEFLNCKVRVEKLPIAFCEGLEAESGDVLNDFIRNSVSLIADESNTDPDTQTARLLGKSFFIIQLLSMRRTNKLEFTNYRLKMQTANVGVFIQYTLSRICGIEKNIEKGMTNWRSLEPLRTTPKVLDLLRKANEFEHVLLKSCTEPSIMIAYLLQFSKCISSHYYHMRIKGELVEIQKARWAVLHFCKSILQTGIRLFGLDCVKEI